MQATPPVPQAVRIPRRYRPRRLNRFRPPQADAFLRKHSGGHGVVQTPPVQAPLQQALVLPLVGQVTEVLPGRQHLGPLLPSKQTCLAPHCLPQLPQLLVVLSAVQTPLQQP